MATSAVSNTTEIMGFVIAVVIGWLMQYLSFTQIIIVSVLLISTMVIIFRKNYLIGFLGRYLSPHFRKPGSGFFGFLCRQLLKANNPIVETTYHSLNVQPHHKVLELGFGYGHGLSLALASGLREGNGKLYGMDFSEEACNHVKQIFKTDIESGKLDVMFGDVANIPLEESTIDRVFHTNCYYFWPEPVAVCREILRVMKPGGLMATGLEPARVKRAAASGFIQFCQTDPAFYMECLVEAGFENVRMENPNTGFTGHKVIFANKIEK